MDEELGAPIVQKQVRVLRVWSKRRENLDTTIDLTIEDSPPRVPRPSTSAIPEVIDLSNENENPNNVASFPKCRKKGKDTNVAMLWEDDDLPPPPKIPLFDQPRPEILCPICYTNMLEVSHVMSTKCGHLFCQNCIEDSLKTRAVCPICRRKVLKSHLHIVYLNQVLS